jgi:hypothetical protein
MKALAVDDGLPTQLNRTLGCCGTTPPCVSGESDTAVDDQHHTAMLRRTMAELGYLCSETTDIAVTLERIAEASVELIDSVHYADILMISHHGDYRSVASTAQLAMVVDSSQQRLHQGPSVDAANNDTVVVCNDLRHDQRWPSFAALAVAAGMAGMSSFPVYTGGSRSVTLNLFGLEPNAFSAEAQAVGAMLATHVALAFLVHDRLVKLGGADGDVPACAWSAAMLPSDPTVEPVLSRPTHRTRPVGEPAVVRQ